MKQAAVAVYADNNATTMMSDAAISSLVRWTNRGNPSSAHGGARAGAAMMQEFREEIAADCEVTLACGAPKDRRTDAPARAPTAEHPARYKVIFTSGASESNCHILTSAARAYRTRHHRLPHILTTEVEHKSVLACCAGLVRDGIAECTHAPVRRAPGPARGTVDPELIAALIRPNTCLVSVMAANNETGAVNDIARVAAAARARGVMMHTDAVQLFGWSRIRAARHGIDAFSVSFHKIGGPPGAGALVIRECRVEDGIGAHICGTQNDEMRGGTENVPAIAASLQAFRESRSRLAAATLAVRTMREDLERRLGRGFGLEPALREHVPPSGRSDRPKPEPSEISASRPLPIRLDLVAPQNERVRLPNTTLLMIRADPHGDTPCAESVRAALEARGIIVGVGSACNAAAPGRPGHPSAVARALGLGDGNIIRISLSHRTTKKDVDLIVVAFNELLGESSALA